LPVCVYLLLIQRVNIWHLSQTFLS